MTTNAAESYMRGWSFAASGDRGDRGQADAHSERGRAAGIAALACVAGRSIEYREGWRDAALGVVQANRLGAYTLGAGDGEAAKQVARTTAHKL